MKNKLLTLCLFAVAAFGAGCSSTEDLEIEPTETFSQAQIINDPRVITDDSFDAACYIARMGEEVQGDGRWQYKLLFANKTTVPQNVYHFMLWYDKDGKLITTPSPVWMSCVVLTGEYKEIRIVAPTREARDFRLYLQGRYDTENKERAEAIRTED